MFDAGLPLTEEFATSELMRKPPVGTAGGGGQAASLARLVPVPRQKLIKVLDGVIGDSSEVVGEPSLGVHVIELRSRDQRGHDGSAVGAPPPKGTCVRSRPRHRRSFSPTRCAGVPAPGEAKVYLPGLARWAGILCYRFPAEGQIFRSASISWELNPV
jgi:hypothetical protein